MTKLEKIRYFLEKLTARRVVGGLQITDSSLQYIYIDGKKGPVNFSLRLPPGVLRNGKIEDRNQFIGVLNHLHDLVLPSKKGEILKIIVSLPAELVYTQSLSIPNVAEERLEDAIHLNLQMVSPIPIEEAYMNSQIISGNQDRSDILGAFVNKKIVEDYRKVFESSNFSPIIFEFPALALSRVVSLFFESLSGPVLVLQISSDGLDISILRNNSLYFDYFRSWNSIQAGLKEIPISLFESVLLEEIQKVINFTLSRFKEIPKKIMILTPGVEDYVKDLLHNRFQIETIPLRVSSYSLGPIWYTTLGSALRGDWDRSKDKFITLGTEGSDALFYQERVLDFVRFWRNVFVGTLASFLLIFAFLGFVLIRQNKTLSGRLSSLLSAPAEKDLSFFGEKADEFNNLVLAVGKVKTETIPWDNFFSDLTRVIDRFGITLERFNINSFRDLIVLTARAPSHDAVIKFKNSLSTESNFSSVDLPLSQITVSEDNTVMFNISFRYGSQSQ